jgi:hypothetical protein
VPGVGIDTEAAAAATWFTRSVLTPALTEIAASVARAASLGGLDGEAAGALVPLASAAAGARAFATRVAEVVGTVAAADTLATAARPPGGASCDVGRELADFVAGELVAFWYGGRDGFPYGQASFGGLRVYRTGSWFAGALDGAVPVFSNGAVGRGLATVLQRLPATAGAGRWLASPGATQAFRWAGVAGAGLSTAVGVRDVWMQGNPVDAFERDGSGYVADVAGTAFSASTTAFLLAPNPVTGALAIVTGAVWLGTEAWDAWGDEISTWVGERADDVGAAAGAAWDAGSDVMSSAWSTVSAAAGDVLATAGDAAGDLWDAGSGAVAGLGDAVGGWFG